ncbi:2-hydroxychromene-2-carboxylate isomerase [Variovorax terrae]|uniref:2-hydroxychromene-2-carboxylate isomerase n=1 Tax=Variovorax terrae TaxID=2923278 RepID=A0A9X2AKT9_9BURK|nr:2-hydroxychromene-2-carboxylate isomerase [Variovorax terrae]MCJ0761898.1 2-hydroxychromene-2-carboxylate isomerase [Variovorax terrae]
MSPKTVEFYFDFGSPASYLAWTQLPGLCAQAGAELAYRPMLLGGVFQATGNHSPATIPAKGHYTFVDFDRFARRYGVPLQRNPHFPINTLTLMRGAAGLQMREPARFLPYCDAVFRAIWVEAKNLNEPAAVAGVLQAAGFDPAALLALTQDAEVKERLKAATQEAIDRGVFGAPTFFVGAQMFWGQDRLDFVKEALQTS